MNPEGHSGLPFYVVHLAPGALLLIGAVLLTLLFSLLQIYWNWRARTPSSQTAASGRNVRPRSPSPNARVSLDAARYPRRYRISTGWQLFMGLCVLGLIAGPLFGLWHLDPSQGTAPQQHANELPAVLSLISVALGFCLAVYVFRYQVILTVDAIEVQQVMTRRRLSHADLLGWRTVRNRNGPASLVLIPKAQGTRRLRLSPMLEIDTEFRDWLATIPDLDAAAIREFEAQVSADASYGMTAADRLSHLKRARQLAVAFNGISMVLSFGVLMYPHPSLMAAWIVTALPWVALGLIHWSKGLYRLFQQRTSGRPDLSLGLIAPIFAIFMKALRDIHILEWHALVLWAVLGGIVLVLLIAAASESLRKDPLNLLLLCPLLCVYAYGTAAEGNRLLDRSAPQSYRVMVVDKHLTHGRHASWYLSLAPWGPRSEARDVAVTPELYESTDNGQTVCIALHDGALNAAWLTVSQCADSG